MSSLPRGSSVGEMDSRERLVLASVHELINSLNAKTMEETGSEAGGVASVQDSAVSPTSPSSPARPGKLIVVANRLPLSISKGEDGKLAYKMSSGGLVSALMSIRDKVNFVWLGWLGKEVADEDKDQVRQHLYDEYRCVPVFITDELADAYYNGYANSELWPRFHYEYSMTGSEKFDSRLWDAYVEANHIFAQEVLNVAVPGDNIWVHDYHLMLVPQNIRRKLSKTTIAWFLHTPWPSSEIYRMLPARSAILKGLLSADLLGFHTYDYARHFLSSCTRVLNDVKVTPSTITYEGNTVDVGVYPIGTEPQHFIDETTSESCLGHVGRLRERFEGKRLVVAVDRLDPIKGIPHRLLALEALFRKHPEWIGKVVFLQVAVPSRPDVLIYQKLTAQVNQLVGSINAQFGNLTYQPVHYMYRSIPTDELCAIYNVGEVALITSLRDGMNLVAEEYIACQAVTCAPRDGFGALVLSEFAGCAQSLPGAVRVNPWSPEDVAEGLHKALTFTAAERETRWRQMFHSVTTFTSKQWALDFISAMQKSAERASAERKKARLPEVPMFRLQGDYQYAQQRLVVLPLEELCKAAGVPSGNSMVSYAAAREETRHKVIGPLQSLCRSRRNAVVVVSKAGMALMEELFRDVPDVFLIAEAGMLLRVPIVAPIPEAEHIQKALETIGTKSLGMRSGYASHGHTEQAAATVHRSVFDVFGAAPVDFLAKKASVADMPVHTVRLVSTRRSRAAHFPKSVKVSVPGGMEQFMSDRENRASPDFVVVGSCWYSTAAGLVGAELRPFQVLAPDIAGSELGSAKSGAHASALPDIFMQMQRGENKTAELAALMQAPIPGGDDWKESVRALLAEVAANTPASYIVDTDNTIQWCFEKSDPDLGAWQSKELQIQLETMLMSAPVDVRVQDACVEIRHRSGSLDTALLHVIDELHARKAPTIDFCMGIADAGDFFGILEALAGILSQPARSASTTSIAIVSPMVSSFLCRVGTTNAARSEAHYSIRSVPISQFLVTLAEKDDEITVKTPTTT